MKKEKIKYNGSSCVIQVRIKKPFLFIRLINKMLGLKDKSRFVYTKIPADKAKI